MNQKIRQPYEVIKIDKYTRRIKNPVILLLNRSFHKIGRISRYTDWNVSLVGDGIDEICFNVHKYSNGVLCPVWDNLVDLKVIDVEDFGRFEISVDYTDNTETVKFIHGFSLETELSQIMLYDFHVNDEDAADMVKTDYSKDNYDEDGNYIPTTFYREILDTDTQEDVEFKKKHSLLHRVLADKAPHWSIGYVTPYIAMEEGLNAEPSSTFQRTYTADGESIYEFLTQTVAKESNVVFVFDTINRKINCYSLCNDAFDPETGKIKIAGVGQDTTILVSKTKLANEIKLSANKDNIKNCFRVQGGDDVITDMVSAVNMNGSKYIYQFAQFQYDDMTEDLRSRLMSYQAMMEDKKTQEAYYGETGIYTRLCNAYDDLVYYESAMMPDTSKAVDIGSAKEQYDKMIKELANHGSYVAVSSLNSYDNNLFVGVTNNIEAYLQILIDSRFELKIIKDTTAYNDKSHVWTGKVQIVQRTDDKNIYPIDESTVNNIYINVNEDKMAFAKQKIEKALSKGSILDIDFEVAGMGEPEMYEYFRKYSLNRLTSFYDGYNSCISILIELGETVNSEVSDTIYYKYEKRLRIVKDVLEERKKDIKIIQDNIDKLKKEQKDFMYGSDIYEPHDFKTYMGDLYNEFCKYRREETYSNNNYISDGLDTAECLLKTKELLDTANKELKKTCMLQRTVSTSLNNLFALPEFEPLYDKFALYNYIRIRTDDELLKLRLIGIEFSGDSVEEIQVTFSEQIESIEGSTGTIRNILKKASNMSGTYASTVLQAKKGTQAKNEIQDIYENGLDTGKAMVTNNENQEVTITSSGIIGKNMYDEGSYGDKQFRITGNTISFTNDNWKSVRMTLGENTFWNPIKKKEETAYGIFADAIVGNMIAGNNMFIGNKNGNVLISGDGIQIDKGTITWGKDKVNPPEMEDIDGFSEFKDKVNIALTGSTEIGSDYVISPKIGGGYLYIKDKRTIGNTGIGIEINPNGTNFTGHNADYVFNVSKNEKLIMGVDTDGNGYFNGNITGSKITGSKIITASKNEDNITEISGGIIRNRGYIADKYSECDIIDGNIAIHSDKNSLTMNSAGLMIYSKKENPEVNMDRYEFVVDLSDLSDSSNSFTTNLKSTFDNNVFMNKELNVDGDITVGNGLGTINGILNSTSDRNLKSDIKPLTEKHMKFFSLLQPVSFKFKDGRSGRTHVGFISQDVENSMKQAGLTDLDFAGFCKDVKIIETEDEYGNTTSQIEKDENGNDVYIYSLRYDEFIALNTFMIQNLYKENQDIKERLLRLEERIDNLERNPK